MCYRNMDVVAGHTAERCIQESYRKFFLLFVMKKHPSSEHEDLILHLKSVSKTFSWQKDYTLTLHF